MALVQPLVAPVASADKPPPDITCASGEQATYGEGAHRFRPPVLVLGCARLGGGQRVQLAAWAVARGNNPSSTCTEITYVRPPQVSFACGRLRHESAPTRVLLLVRYRSTLPIIVLGVAPARAERVAAVYSTTAGARREASATLLQVGDEVAKKVGTANGFTAFVAELGPGADVCGGVTPRAFDRSGRRWPAEPAVPPGDAFLGRSHGGWVTGFTSGWGSGLGTPAVCAGVSNVAEVKEGPPWTVVAAAAGVLMLIALVVLRRLKPGRRARR